MQRALILLMLLLGYALLSCQQISLRTSADDLGRHIRDGELILAGKSPEILHHNFYSYAHPESEFVNHHWLASIFFFLIWKTAGLNGLSVLYALLGAAAMLIYFWIAEREAGLAIAGAIAAICLPLLAVRSGVRPELFSMLLLSIFFAILWRVYRGEIRPVWLWTLPAVEILWVNLHPGFVLGPVLIGCFLIGAPALRRRLAAVLGATILAGLVNPNGISGLLFPITVPQNYGFSVRENLSPFSLNDLWISKVIEVAVVVLIAAFYFVWRRKARIDWPLLLFSFAIAAMSLHFYRVYVFLGPFVFISLCVNLRAAGWLKRAPFVPLAALWAAAFLNAAIYVNPIWDTLGIGQAPGDDTLAQFLRDNSVQGRVFNDYSTGGYLIYYFPGQKVFVDSRPEAYPAGFLEHEYTAPIKSDDAWKEVLGKYDFDFICFGRLNQEHGQFIVRRMHDPEWALVSGGSDVVLVRRKPQFSAVIATHEIRVH